MKKSILALAVAAIAGASNAHAISLEELLGELRAGQNAEQQAGPVIAGAEGTIEFTGVVAPATDAEKRVILSSQYAFVDGKQTEIGFHTILTGGEQRGDWKFGQLIDSQGNRLVDDEGNDRISVSNDFSSLLGGADKSDNKLFMVSNFESRPAAMYLTELRQAANGELSAIRTRPLDFSHVAGGWVHCAGSVTPWDTHLGSEEYEPDQRQRDPATGSINSYYDAMGDYYGGDLLALNPYDYGFNVEVAVDDFHNATVTKHYAMGRVAIELSYVMPNEKTAYITDDGTNVGLFRFEADNPGDLSSGRLYAAVYQETSTEGMGSANLDWVDMGHATNAQVKALIDSGTTFNDIFDRQEPAEGGGCAAGYTEVNHTYGHECLMLKPGMEVAASRLETRRYAAMLGGTTEWRKMEGITFDPDHNRLYLAMSEIARGMENNMKNGSPNASYDVGGHNHINVRYNNCGGVYAMDVDANYKATNIYGLIAGIPTQAYDAESSVPAYDENGPYAANKCHLDGLANPDNITYMPGYNTVIIGEDTGSGHQNDIIWSYNLDTQALTRIQTTPYGSETTSPYFYPNINGYAYLISVVQHPYGESDSDKAGEMADPVGAAMGVTGYIGPFPAMGE